MSFHLSLINQVVLHEFETLNVCNCVAYSEVAGLVVVGTEQGGDAVDIVRIQSLLRLNSMPFCCSRHANQSLPLASLVTATSGSLLRLTWVAGALPRVEQAHPPLFMNNNNAVRAVSISPDGLHVLVGCRDGSIVLYHAETGLI